MAGGSGTSREGLQGRSEVHRSGRSSHWLSAALLSAHPPCRCGAAWCRRGPPASPSTPRTRTGTTRPTGERCGQACAAAGDTVLQPCSAAGAAEGCLPAGLAGACPGARCSHTPAHRSSDPGMAPVNPARPHVHLQSASPVCCALSRAAAPTRARPWLPPLPGPPPLASHPLPPRPHAHRSSDLGMALVNFARIVPDGLLVFFPSYALLAVGAPRLPSCARTLLNPGACFCERGWCLLVFFPSCALLAPWVPTARAAARRAAWWASGLCGAPRACWLPPPPAPRSRRGLRLLRQRAGLGCRLDGQAAHAAAAQRCTMRPSARPPAAPAELRRHVEAAAVERRALHLGAHLPVGGRAGAAAAAARADEGQRTRRPASSGPRLSFCQRTGDPLIPPPAGPRGPRWSLLQPTLTSPLLPFPSTSIPHTPAGPSSRWWSRARAPPSRPPPRTSAPSWRTPPTTAPCSSPSRGAPARRGHLARAGCPVGTGQQPAGALRRKHASWRRLQPVQRQRALSPALSSRPHPQPTHAPQGQGQRGAGLQRRGGAGGGADGHPVPHEGRPQGGRLPRCQPRHGSLNGLLAVHAGAPPAP